MKYHINFSYENIIVPMNAQTAAAIETLFGKSEHYRETWHNSKEGFVQEPREFRIKVISDEDFQKRLAAGIEAVQAGSN